MRQLILDVRPDWVPSFDDFVPGQNAALLNALNQHAHVHDGSVLYMWGEQGCGRTHLLRAIEQSTFAVGRSTIFTNADSLSSCESITGSLLLVDDVERCSAEGQDLLFRALIGAREAGNALVLSGSQPPVHLSLREDIRTRIAQGLVFEIKPLADDDKAKTLQQHAAQRGMYVDTAIVGYLLRHGRRDLPWLMSVLDALDEASLTHGRRITLNLLRDILRESQPSLPPEPAS